jgi:hypothetical protein
MPDRKVGDYNASTWLRACCFFGMGLQVASISLTKVYPIEGIIFLVVYAAGLYVSKAKNNLMLKALLGISVLVGIARGFFLINGYSEKPTLGKEPFVLTGIYSMSPMQVLQLILSLQIAYLLYVLT